MERFSSPYVHLTSCSCGYVKEYMVLDSCCNQSFKIPSATFYFSPNTSHEKSHRIHPLTRKTFHGIRSSALFIQKQSFFRFCSLSSFLRQRYEFPSRNLMHCFTFRLFLAKTPCCLGGFYLKFQLN